ncbi:hypothetical protein ABIB58_001984 [Brevundimonas sp. UYEF29]|uniref:hypothetical protein n=1 Tax=Brevundimonas sp. UYEF29 TaxID=3156346 RepID=UPI003396E044
MSHHRVLAALASSALIGLALAGSAVAQSAGPTSNPEYGGRAAPGNPSDPSRAQSTRETSASRLRENRQNRRQQAPSATAPTAEQVLASAQEQATVANTKCQVTEAKLLGQTADKTSVFEVACGAEAGFIIEAKTPPVATSCINLAYSARIVRERDPTADVGMQCTIAANTDVDLFIRAYAQQASVPCSVDQTKVLGQSGDGAVVYEIGCADAAGYWIQKEGEAWTKTPCIRVLAESGVCEFTTVAENAAFVKGLLAGSDAASCNVTEARLMGQNANGVFYEAKCDGADGVIARVNTENAVQQVYPCATAQRIGGGCKLTMAAPAAAPAPAGGRP